MQFHFVKEWLNSCIGKTNSNIMEKWGASKLRHKTKWKNEKNEAAPTIIANLCNSARVSDCCNS